MKYRNRGFVNMNEGLFDEMGKPVEGRLVNVESLPVIFRIIGCVTDPRVWGCIQPRDYATSDESSPLNVDYYKKLYFQGDQAATAADAIAVPSGCVYILTCNQQPFRAVGYSNNNQDQIATQYNMFKFNQYGQTTNLNLDQYGFLNFDGANCTTQFKPHDSVLWSGQALGGQGGSDDCTKAHYIYCGGSRSAAAQSSLNILVTAVGQNFTAGGALPQFGVTVVTASLVKFNLSDEVEWEVSEAAGVLGGAGNTTWTFSFNIYEEDDYAIQLQAVNGATNFSAQVFQGPNRVGATAADIVPQPSGSAYQFYPTNFVTANIQSTCSFAMTWHAIPEIQLVMNEGVGFTGVGMGSRVYYDGPIGSNGAPAGDFAAAKCLNSNDWRNFVDASRGAGPSFDPISNLATLGPNGDELVHVAWANTHGARWFEKPNSLTDIVQMKYPWRSLGSLGSLQVGGSATYQVDGVEFPLDIRGGYTLACIQTPIAGGLFAGAQGSGPAAFGFECAWAFTRQTRRQTAYSCKPFAKPKDWHKALQVLSDLPFCWQDSSWNWYDLLAHPAMAFSAEEQEIGTGMRAAPMEATASNLSTAITRGVAKLAKGKRGGGRKVLAIEGTVEG